MKESVINIGIETYTIDETIHSEQYMYDDVEKTRQIMSERIINTQDEQIREQLIKLGWTPPDDIESRVCENCKYLEYGTFDNTLYCSIDCSSNQYRREKTVTKDFGCNKFKRKVESK